MKYRTLKGLLRSEKRWSQGSGAKDQDGETTRATSTRAVSWCMYSGLFKVYQGDEYREAVDRLELTIKKLFPVRGQRGIISFNDDPETTHKQILRVVRRANV